MSDAFPELAALLRNDPGKVRLMARVFCRSVTLDLQLLDEAVATRQWKMVSELAQRIHLGCLQMCESRAAQAAIVLADVRDASSEAYVRHRAEIADLLKRAQACAFNGTTDRGATRADAHGR